MQYREKSTIAQLMKLLDLLCLKDEASQHSPGNKLVVWEFANGRSLAAVGDRITKGIVMGVGQVIFVVGFGFFFPSGALSRIKFMLVTN